MLVLLWVLRDAALALLVLPTIGKQLNVLTLMVATKRASLNAVHKSGMHGECCSLLIPCTAASTAFSPLLRNQSEPSKAHTPI